MYSKIRKCPSDLMAWLIVETVLLLVFYGILKLQLVFLAF